MTRPRAPDTPTRVRKPAILWILAVSGCSAAGREAQWEKKESAPPAAGTAAGTSSAAIGMIQEADAAWALRDDRAKLERAIALWSKAAESDRNNAAPMI